MSDKEQRIIIRVAIMELLRKCITCSMDAVRTSVVLYYSTNLGVFYENIC